MLIWNEGCVIADANCRARFDTAFETVVRTYGGRVVLRKNLCRDRFQLVVMMQAAETRAADDTMRGR